MKKTIVGYGVTVSGLPAEWNAETETFGLYGPMTIYYDRATAKRRIKKHTTEWSLDICAIIPLCEED